MSLQVGDMISFERTFTIEDVELFAKVSQDEGIHHVTPDEQGRLVVHGLLTATLPTKIGGDLNVLARNMNFVFLKPVYTGDTIVCEVKVEKYEWQEEKNRTAIHTIISCKNQHNIVILTGDFTGVILNNQGVSEKYF